MKWDDLRIFLAVARSESLSGAGRLLRLDPATVGRHIQRLEQSLETPLFAKSPQGYTLTEPGQRLVDHAERTEQAVTLAIEDVRGETGRLSGQIRIGAPDGCANFLLPQVCAAIMAANPGLEVQIIALPRVFDLSKREADMAVTVSPPATRRLVSQTLTDYRLHLVGNHNYLLEKDKIRTRGDLSGHHIVGYVPDMIFDKELDYLSELGLGPASIASNSVSVQLHLIRHGAGLGVVHDFALPATPGLQKVLADEIELTRTFYLIRHADDAHVERLNRFAEALIDGIRREVVHLEALT